MPGITTGLIVGASAAGSIGAGVLAKKGATAQAKAAEQSSAAAIAEQRRQFDITRGDLMPWLQAGNQALQTLQFLLGLGVPPGQAQQIATTSTAQSTGLSPEQVSTAFQQLQNIGGRDGFGMALDGGVGDAFQPAQIGTEDGRPFGFPGGPGATTGTGVPPGQDPSQFGSLMRDFSASDFQADPGYAFRLAEGMKALERSAASRGTVLSGGTLKELARFNQGFASNEFQNAFNRFQENRRTRFNQLASIAGVGQQTGAQLGQFGANTATNIGNLLVGGQTAAAAARASGYGAIGNTLQNLGNIPLNLLMLRQLGGAGGGGASVGSGGGA